MLGGGVWVTQNKKLPGSYINFVNRNTGGATFSDRGVVAIPLDLNTATSGMVIKVTLADFIQKPTEILGENIPNTSMIALRELFKHAQVVYVVNTFNNGGELLTPEAIIKLLDQYEFNVLAVMDTTDPTLTIYTSAINNWRDTMGKKCIMVCHTSATPTPTLDYEGIINVVNDTNASEEEKVSLVPWVAGAEASCAINRSCTNMLYDGELDIKVPHTQSELETCVTNGEFVFHRVYSDIRVLKDINTMTTTTADKGVDFKSNQTIRVCDQIANDIAKLFNTSYIGKIQNNYSGQMSFKSDLIKHHRTLEQMEAIRDLNTDEITVVQGETKDSILVNDAITVVNAMEKLYMTVVVG